MDNIYIYTSLLDSRSWQSFDPSSYQNYSQASIDLIDVFNVDHLAIYYMS